MSVERGEAEFFTIVGGTLRWNPRKIRGIWTAQKLGDDDLYTCIDPLVGPLIKCLSTPASVYLQTWAAKSLDVHPSGMFSKQETAVRNAR